MSKKDAPGTSTTRPKDAGVSARGPGDRSQRQGEKSQRPADKAKPVQPDAAAGRRAGIEAKARRRAPPAPGRRAPDELAAERPAATPPAARELALPKASSPAGRPADERPAAVESPPARPARAQKRQRTPSDGSSPPQPPVAPPRASESTQPFEPGEAALFAAAEAQAGSAVELAPSTRRSSPLPCYAPGVPEPRIPPLPRVTVELAPPLEPAQEAGGGRGASPEAAGAFAWSPAPAEGSPETDVTSSLDFDAEPSADVAPIGPTEAAAVAASGVESARPAASAPSSPATVEELEEQIRDLETRLERMIRAGRVPPAAQPSSPGVPRPAPSSSELRGNSPSDEQGTTARELLSGDYYLRQWGRIGMRNRSEEVDEFGLDPTYEARFRPLFDLLYKRYFRVDTEGAHAIPEEGRCIVVSNHSGGPLPYDGMMLRTAVRREHPRARELRWLAEDFIYYLPFAGAVMNRLGAVRACQENAERLLAGGNAVAVFPEGVKGVGKLYAERYKLQRFGRGGFIRLCLRTQTPLVPCAIVGAEEANPMLHRVEYMTKSLGIPYLPITPTFPAFGLLGLLPAPTKWKIRFGEVMRFDAYGPEAADDEILVGRLTERVRSTIQSMLDRVLAERKSIWLG